MKKRIPYAYAEAAESQKGLGAETDRTPETR